MILANWKYIALAASIFALLGPVVSCSPSRSSPTTTADNTPQAVVVSVVPAMIGDISEITTYSANLDAKDQVDLFPLATGRVERLNVDVGSEIHQGQVIAELSHGTLEAQLLQAQAALINAQAQLASAQTQLRQLKNPTDVELASAQSMVAGARLGLSVAQGKVDQEIQRESAADAGSGVPWGIILIAHQNIEDTNAILFQTTVTRYHTPEEISTLQEIVATNQEIVSRLLAENRSSTRISHDITTALWAEAAAQADLDQALAKLNDLMDPNPDTIALAEFRVDAAQAMVQQAQGQVELVNQQLSDTRILAPFGGFVLRRMLSPGALASPQTPVVTLSSYEVVVTIQVDETDIDLFNEDQLLSLSTAGKPERGLKLRIDQVSLGGDRRAHTFLVQLRAIEATPELRPGTSGEVSVETRHDGVVLVPKQAIVYQNNQATLYVLQDGRARLRKVSTALENRDKVEVNSGVLSGELVVVSGNENLKDGGLAVLQDG